MAVDPIVCSSATALMGTGSALPANYLTTSVLLASSTPYLSDRMQRVAMRWARKLDIDSRYFSRALAKATENPAVADSAPRLAGRALRAALQSSDLDVAREATLLDQAR